MTMRQRFMALVDLSDINRSRFNVTLLNSINVPNMRDESVKVCLLIVFYMSIMFWSIFPTKHYWQEQYLPGTHSNHHGFKGLPSCALRCARRHQAVGDAHRVTSKMPVLLARHSTPCVSFVASIRIIVMLMILAFSFIRR